MIVDGDAEFSVDRGICGVVQVVVVVFGRADSSDFQ